MWVAGGSFPQGDEVGCLNDVWCSTNGTDWTQVTPAAPWLPRDGHQLVAYNGKIWVLGGRNASNDTNYCLGDVWSSPDGLNWTQVDEMAPWGPRTGHSAVVFNGKIWVMGDGNAADVWAFEEGPAFRFTELPRGGWREQGEQLALEVGLQGAVGQVTYRWLKDSLAIPDATDETFTIPSLTFEDQGWYSCRVTDESKAEHETPPVFIQVFAAGSLPMRPVGAATAIGLLCLTVAVLALRRRNACGPRRKCRP
jgi:hypothetical protein